MNSSALQSQTDSKPPRWTARLTPGIFFVLFFALAQGCTSGPAPAAAFASPDKAVESLVTSLRTNDQDQLRKIFGNDGEKILSSGDEVADRRSAEKFLQAYDEQHQLQPNNDGSMTLLVGDRSWPSPVPIIKDEKTNTWYFDSQAGAEEILNRRIGRNELTVIQVCQAIADAQREYAQRDPDNDGIPEYAQKFISDPGKKNGLYWETADNEPPSPLGPLVAHAVEQGYSTERMETGKVRPYHGYFYRMLKSQGPNAPGGTLNYVVNGKMIGGFAVVAYPAEYANSGIMTFIVDYHGDVYQKDLGRSTEITAAAISSFDPGPGWQIVEPTTLSTK